MKNKETTSFIHKEKAPKEFSFGIIIVSDSRFQQVLKRKEIIDESGRVLEEALKKDGHKKVFEFILPDDKEIIMAFVKFIAKKENLDTLIFIGGTGISNRDVTIEALEEVSEKKMKGFGEIFRFLSYKEIGSSAILSRAEAYIYHGKIIYCLPGSPNAVKVALPLILKETGHVLRHLKE